MNESIVNKIRKLGGNTDAARADKNFAERQRLGCLRDRSVL